MKNILHAVSLLIVPFISLQAGDEDDVLRAEHELALCYQNSDAACIEQGMMEDYILINSRGKISTRADDLAEAKKGDPKYEIFENHDIEGAGTRRFRCRDRRHPHKRDFRRPALRRRVSLH